jgi:predicted Rossmann fold nucleotide-binding protein DprA/Smf involved in DNA uptake
MADAAYPLALRAALRDEAPGCLSAAGNLGILRGKVLALFCSVKCPGNLILQTYDAACALRDAGVTVVGGFHSPMEGECLMLLLRGTQPVVVCPARGIEGMRLPGDWKKPMADGRLLVLSPFGEKDRRVTADLARRRNEFVAALADDLLVAHAERGSATEQLVRRALRWGKRVLTLDSPENLGLIASGAQAVGPESVTSAFLGRD